MAKSQISIEYLIIVGFVTLAIIGVLGIALLYSGMIKDKIKLTQLSNFAEKVVSSAEIVFYYSTPSRATISVYLPDNVNSIEIAENSLIFTFQTSSGTNKISFTSKVPILGSLSTSSGLQKVRLEAEENLVRISNI